MGVHSPAQHIQPAANRPHNGAALALLEGCPSSGSSGAAHSELGPSEPHSELMPGADIGDSSDADS